MNSPAHASRTSRTDGAARSLRPANASDTSVSARTPLLLCGLVMAVAMMSFFVHLLENHVERGQRLRQAMAQSPAPVQQTGFSQEFSAMLQPLQVGAALSR